jgi:uncharacterized Tic20 family protein
MEQGWVAPPGWYPAADGRMWWWDGYRWSAPPAAPAGSDDRVWAVLSHLAFFCGVLVIGPLGVRLTVGRRDAFIREHATEALNAQLTFGLVWNLFGLPLVLQHENDALLWLLIGPATAFVWMLVTSVIASTRAGRGESWHYPGSIPFVGRREARRRKAERSGSDGPG